MSDLESLDGVPGLLKDRDVAGLSLAFVTGPDAAPVTGTWGWASAASSPPRLGMLTREGIGAAIRMNNRHLSAPGTYRLPGGQLVALTATEPDRWNQCGPSG